MATSYKNIKNVIETDIKWHTDQGYQMIRGHVYNPARSIFVSDRNNRSSIQCLFCNACDKCDAYKNNLCTETGNVFLRPGRCPHAKHYYMQGPTKRSKSYNDFIKDAESALNISYTKFSTRLDSLHSTMIVGGDYIYLHLPHLANYVNPIADEVGMVNHDYVPVDMFTDEMIVKLLEYHPQAIFGGEITSYQDVGIPKFILDLKHNFPEIFNRVIKGTKYQDKILSLDYRNKRAVLSTLKPGQVKYNQVIWNWDGTYLTPTDENSTIGGMYVDQIKPKPNTYVIIVDNNTVDEDNTKFKD